MPKWAEVYAWLTRHRGLVLVCLLLLAVDRASKVWAFQALAVHGPIVFGPYFWLNYVENTGAAFGMFQHANGLLVGVMLAVIGYIVWSWKDLVRNGRLAEWGGSLILAGAFGNLYDRLSLGFVVDFLDFRVWPVFNIADSCITVGAVLVGLGFICYRPQQEGK